MPYTHSPALDLHEPTCPFPSSGTSVAGPPAPKTPSGAGPVGHPAWCDAARHAAYQSALARGERGEEGGGGGRGRGEGGRKRISDTGSPPLASDNTKHTHRHTHSHIHTYTYTYVRTYNHTYIWPYQYNRLKPPDSGTLQHRPTFLSFCRRASVSLSALSFSRLFCARYCCSICRVTSARTRCISALQRRGGCSLSTTGLAGRLWSQLWVRARQGTFGSLSAKMCIVVCEINKGFSLQMHSYIWSQWYVELRPKGRNVTHRHIHTYTHAHERMWDKLTLHWNPIAFCTPQTPDKTDTVFPLPLSIGKLPFLSLDSYTRATASKNT